jgi:hypothetical protein
MRTQLEMDLIPPLRSRQRPPLDPIHHQAAFAIPGHTDMMREAVGLTAALSHLRIVLPKTLRYPRVQ